MYSSSFFPSFFYFIYIFKYLIYFSKNKKKRGFIEFVKWSQPKGEILMQYVGWKSTPFETCLYLLLRYYDPLRFFVDDG